jgi:predicted nucleic acid-binding protein
MTGSSGTIREIVDTNILIYAADPAAGAKHKRALDLIQELTNRSSLTLSVQVLNEFYAVATRPNKPPSLSHEEAKQIVHDLALSAMVLPLTAAVTFRALDSMVQHGPSFWDALIWAAAKENDVPVIYTEDFQDGRDIEGVRYSNPFLVSP